MASELKMLRSQPALRMRCVRYSAVSPGMRPVYRVDALAAVNS
jgi:hypothetical protein